MQVWLEKLSKSRWYLPVLTFLMALDAYIFIVPNEALLIPAIMARKKKWIRTTFWLTIGSTVGAASFAWLTSLYGEKLLIQFFPKLIQSSSWGKGEEIIQSYGLWGLAFISFSPLPQHPAVAIAGLAHLSVVKVFFAVLLGRGIKYLQIALCVVYSPKLLSRFFLKPKQMGDAGKASKKSPN